MMHWVTLATAVVGALAIWWCVEHEIKIQRKAAYQAGFERGSDEGFYRGYAQGRQERDE